MESTIWVCHTSHTNVYTYFHITVISPPPFPLNCDIINIHGHNLHI